MPVSVATKRRLIGHYTIGQNFQLNTRTPIDLTQIPTFINVGFKSIITRFEFKLSLTFTIPTGAPALSTLFLKYLLNKDLVGPGQYNITQGRMGWHDPIWAFLQRGEVDGVRARDIAAGTTSATRTWTQHIDFEEPLVPDDRYARCYPVEAFKAPNSGLWLTLQSPVTIKGVALTISSGWIEVYAHVIDVAPNKVPLPIPVSEFAVRTNSGDVAPSPGPGKYLRVAMANSPVPGDNVDTAFGSGTNTSDDLSAYTSIESFGVVPNMLTVDHENVDLLLQRVMRDVSQEQHSQLDNPTGNKGEFRLGDPIENFDGLTRVITLVYPSKGSSLLRAPLFLDYPRLHANNDSRTGLPAGFFFLCQRIDPRSDAMLNALVASLTSTAGKSLLGRQATINAAHIADPSRAQMTIDARG